MPEFIIVGSGAAGTAAALALARLGIRPILLDVGHTDSGNAHNGQGQPLRLSQSA